MVNRVDFFKEGAGVIRTIECNTYCSLAVGLDNSWSMHGPMSNGKSRFQNAVDEFEQTLLKLAANETLAENVHLSVLLFGDNRVDCIIDGVALCDIKIAELCQNLRSRQCSGGTPMGRCIVEALDRLQAAKERARNAQIEYAQPILMILSDGEPTDSMVEAKRRIDELADVNGQQKVVPLFMGIGERGATFKQFEDLLEKYKETAFVANNADGVREQFRFLGKTVRAVSRGQYIVPSNDFGKVRTIAQNAARNARPGAPAAAGGDY